MWTLAEILLTAVALYPVVTAALWMAGGALFRISDEHREVLEPAGGWPGVSILIPAYNEALVVATSISAARRVDYPELEILVLDDGSTDDTAGAARIAAADDHRCQVIRDPENRGKADRLNQGFRQARHELVVVIDADTHLHPQALKLLAARMCRTPILAAVAGAPHVTNRGHMLEALQIVEFASVVGLIRRTQALTGRVGIVAGVLGMFHRDRVLAVGGYDARMATEDIDLTWRLLLAGWHTDYEPHALIGMQVPSTMRGLWEQRKRWARGQGEALRVHVGTAIRPRNHRMWLVIGESLVSLVWVVALLLSLVAATIALFTGHYGVFGFGVTWGVAIAVVATAQLMLALLLEHRYDPLSLRAFMLGPIYPLAYWAVNASAAVRCQVWALMRGPREERVVWDVPREALEEGHPS